MEIPIIDFAPWYAGDWQKRHAIAQQIYQACDRVGFMYLQGIGIPKTLIAKTFAESRHFFNLPVAEKNQVAWSNENSNRGYVGLERERLDPNKPGDLKEAFNVGKECDLNANQWLPGQERFRDTVLEFYQACAAAAEQMCRAFAIALQLPENFFTERHNQQDYTLRLLHYPAILQAPKPEQIRAGEHSDYGSFTFLFQDDIGGLEICTAAGEWIAAPTIPDTVIVNTGDLMERWTNHIFRSTRHRVCIPNNEKASQSRYSIAFFCHPNFDTEIACLETCQERDRAPIYPPISAGEYLLNRLQATY